MTPPKPQPVLYALFRDLRAGRGDPPLIWCTYDETLGCPFVESGGDNRGFSWDELSIVPHRDNDAPIVRKWEELAGLRQLGI